MNERERRKLDVYLLRFTEAMQAWGWSRRTIPSYKGNVRRFLEWISNETDAASLDDVTPDLVSSYQTALLAEVKRNGEPLSSVTQSMRLLAVRAFFAYLHREGVVPVN